MRKQFIFFAGATFTFYLWATFFAPIALYTLVVTAPLLALGFKDYFQKKQSILRNFPILGHFRYLMEAVRPEIHQYFIETNSEGKPFSRENRSLIYQRAKKVTDTLPFGTQKNLYEIGYELESATNMIGAMGLKDPQELKPFFLIRRYSETEVRNYTQMYEYLKEGDLLKSPYPESYQFAMSRSSPDTFNALEVHSEEYKKAA